MFTSQLDVVEEVHEAAMKLIQIAAKLLARPGLLSFFRSGPSFTKGTD